MNKMLTCLLVSVLLLGVLTVGVAEAADAGLVAHYQLDEGSGTVARDSSDNGYDGELLGQPEWVAGPDDSGVALAFNPNDGCAGIECPTFDPTDGTGQFSFTIWAFWDGEETYHHFFTKSDGWGTDTMMFQLELWGGSTSAAHFNRIGISYAPNSTAFYEMPKNEWTHLAFVYDGAEMVVYLNGVDEMGPQAVEIGPATDARTVIGVANDDARVWTGVLDDVQIYSRVLGEGEVAKIMEGSVGLSSAPQPEDEATDVALDVALAWTAGEFAATHDVYLGTTFDDVNDASRADPMDLLAAQDESATTYQPPALLEYGQTYYWRVDEVNAAPDYTIFRGAVWSFSTEPIGYPVEGVVATSNGTSAAGVGPENTVNGSGLDADDQHSTDEDDMWLAAPGDDALVIEFAFDHLCKLHEMWVWNYNSQFEMVLGFGLKDVTVEYSVDGAEWISLGDVELAQAPGAATCTASTAIELAGVAARYVRLAANSGWGALGAQFGLSEVRFFEYPVQAREPAPANGDSEIGLDASLAWRTGRGAAGHEVYLGPDAASLELVASGAETALTPDDLQFGTTYYWRVDEVNEAEVVSVWEGILWNFSTMEFATVEDFESYDNADNVIYETWIDGWVNGSGSTVGYLTEPFAETSIVHGGRQSMPLEYLNGAAPYYSEAERDLGGADWTVGGADTLRLYVYGSAANDAATLYVAVEDTSGSVAVASHPDQAVVTTEAWQEWTISYADLGGVNLAAVRMIYVGVGDRDNPASGGSGLIFIDDIQFGKPAVE